jgi:hypothetical protein
MDVLDTTASPDLANLDPCAQAGGPNTALVKTISGVAVTDGSLGIQSVYGTADDPEIAAIEILPASGPPAPPGPPTVTSRSPAVGATGVSTGTTVTATFSRAMDPATITSSSFTLTPSGGSPVAATVSYTGATTTATLTPSAALANSTTYTANLTTAVKASDGQALAAAVSWTFTTAPAGGPGTTTTRINAGGGAYTSGTGATFIADANFTGGSTYATSSAITGTNDPALYQNERWGQFTYNIPVTNGTYTVRLHFVELYYGTAVPGSCVGKRIFGIDVLNTPGSADIANLDVCAQAGGPNIALVRNIAGVQVTNGTLSIQSVYGSTDDPEIAAIEITPG